MHLAIHEFILTRTLNGRALRGFALVIISCAFLLVLRLNFLFLADRLLLLGGADLQLIVSEAQRFVCGDFIVAKKISLHLQVVVLNFLLLHCLHLFVQSLLTVALKLVLVLHAHALLGSVEDVRNHVHLGLDLPE